jgi:hypothetical protein
MKTDVNEPSKNNKQKTWKFFFFLASCQALTEKAGSRPVSQWYGSADPDPDPYQNVTVPQH